MKEVVADLLHAIELPDPVVEFGAMQVESEQDGDLRPLFAGRDYTGTDMREGPGVDRIEDLRALSFADGSVGTALCLDTLEHCEDPPQACRELARVTAHQGVCVISSVMLFGIHAYPSDYFRFTPEGFRSLLAQGFEHVTVAGIGDPSFPYAVIGLGSRRPVGLELSELPTLEAAQERFEAADGKVRFGPLRPTPKELSQALAKDLPRLAKARLSAAARRARAGR
jgi:SAM-dependent methyltransferase